MSNEEGNEVEIDASLLAEKEVKEEIPETTEERKEPEQPEIPSKYQGKSAAEIIRMHQDAERLLGKQGNEVGELRKIVDDMLAANAQPSNAPEEPEEDFFANPSAAISKVVKNTLSSDPRLQQLEVDADNARKEKAARALASAHPDYIEVVNSTDFGEWIGKSKLRLKAFQESHKNFDTETASELISEWKERQQLVQSTSKAAQGTRSKAVKNAATGSGKASSETRGKPILSRSALIELKSTDPDKYYSMMPQIKAAYVEKRVR